MIDLAKGCRTDTLVLQILGFNLSTEGRSLDKQGESSFTCSKTNHRKTDDVIFRNEQFFPKYANQIPCNVNVNQRQCL